MKVEHATAIACERFEVGIGYPDRDLDGSPFVALTFEDTERERLTFVLSPGAALRLAELLVSQVRVPAAAWPMRAARTR